MAFSDQFYFVAAALTYGSLLAVYGSSAAIYNAYQLYRDNFFVPLFIFMMMMCWSIEIISVKLGRYIGLWFRAGEEENLEKAEIKKQGDRILDEEGDDFEDDGGATVESSKTSSKDQNTQYRALAEIGMSESKLQVLDARLADIHNLPAGFTAAEMSFRLLDDVFADVLQNLHTSQLAPSGKESDITILSEMGLESTKTHQHVEFGLKTQLEQKQGLHDMEQTMHLDEKSQDLFGKTIAKGQNSVANGKAKHRLKQTRNMPPSVDSERKVAGMIEKQKRMPSKETISQSSLVPSCFADSEMYHGWLYFEN